MITKGETLVSVRLYSQLDFQVVSLECDKNNGTMLRTMVQCLNV